MIYAQFYQMSTGYVLGTIPPEFGAPTLIEACGDRSVIIIDARLSRDTIGQIAAAECVKRGYMAWRIFKGETFTRSQPISQLWYVSTGREDKTAMSATFGA